MAQKAQKIQKKKLSREQRRLRTNQIIFTIVAVVLIAAWILALVAK